VPLEVADPILGDEEMFERCYDHIARATAAIAQLCPSRERA
jgi:hypothetical protein